MLILNPYRGWRADVERSKQKLLILRGMDPEQREDCHLWYSTSRPQNVGYIHREHNRSPGVVQEDRGAIFGWEKQPWFLDTSMFENVTDYNP